MIISNLSKKFHKHSLFLTIIGNKILENNRYINLYKLNESKSNISLRDL